MTGTDQTRETGVDETSARVEISLRVLHASATPEQISSALHLSPTLSYAAGAARVTQTGRELNSVHRETLWSLDVDIPYNASLAEAICAADALAAPRQQAIVTLKSSGARVEYFVGLFLSDHRTDVLDSALLARCGKQGIDLVLNVYAPPSASNS